MKNKTTLDEIIEVDEDSHSINTTKSKNNLTIQKTSEIQNVND